ncbi:uncharacterized protein LOC110708109 [Chenopodium quinoa]|uniref:uncharacterized protein LOC110708109 n=1 Tax=Chenopodium quinoa TaxID=63459 RepID=UPI000B77B2DC|nr:uncharacterized protein LOC110708109 [Chenopodium quinoa]
MFGMGFILNERTESFEWLFDTFLTSMGRRSPITIMTDQAQAIAAGIRNIFPKGVHHRLCVWHIEQNSKKHIGALRALDGFTDLFGYLLKYCETPPEFEHYWKRMLLKYDCANVDWLNDLYKIKEMWCPAFSKKFWSGVCFHLNVVRQLTNQFLKGLTRHKVYVISIKCFSISLYTIQAYVLFEEGLIKGTACDHKDAGVNFPEYYYHLWRPGKYMIKHEIPDDYICKRWTKAAMCSHGLDEPAMKTNIESVTGTIDFNEPVEGIEIVDHEVKNPAKSRPIGERNYRPKSNLEKAYNKARGQWLKKKSVYTPYKRSKGQAVVRELDENGCPISYANSLVDPNELIVIEDPSAQVCNKKTAIVEDIPSDDSVSNDFEQEYGYSSMQSNVTVDPDISSIVKGKTAAIAHDVDNFPISSQLPPKKPRNVQFPTVVHAQINAQAPSKVSSIVQNPPKAPRNVQVRSSVPKKVQAPSNVPRSTQGCFRNVQVDSNISRNVHDVPNVPRSTQGNSRNVQVSPSV